MNVNGNEPMDPLDAFMATLVVDGAVETTVDAREVARTYRHHQLHRPAAEIMDVVARNRRYAKLQELLKVDANSDDGAYFSDETMKQRNPALYHLHLGQYLNVASRQQTPRQDNLTLSSFLMETCERQTMEARRVAEQQRWGNYRSVDDTTGRDKDDDEEEEEEDDDDNEEAKEGENDSTETDELSIDDRRAQLIELMSQRFLDGCDDNDVDYAAIDADERLDDFEQIQRDAEDQYFDSD